MQGLRLFCGLALVLSTPVAAAVPVVATDIPPVHSIAARVMQGVGEPGLILPPGASPHGYSLRPSEAQLLSDADIVVWIGPALTPWLADPIDVLAPDAKRVTLTDAPGVVTLPVRTGAFEPDADAPHPPIGGTAPDGHLWLDPENAVAFAGAIGAALAAADPEHAAAYLANVEAFATETAAEEGEIAARVAPLRGRPYLVFHDAYQYFEHRFDLPAAGSVELQDGVTPGTARVAAIRDRVLKGGIQCAFSEPEFEPKLLYTVTEGTPVRLGVLDGLGSSLPPGPALYPALLEGIATSLEECLGG
ncbi:MAG: zinc ABC transporter substrate-binding protein [Amaricoccus sp.]